MSYAIMRIEKRTSTDIKNRGLRLEANRTPQDHFEKGVDFDNSDIDWSRTHLNYHLVKSNDWWEAVKEKTNQYNVKIRKDSVVLLDGLYTASPGYFENLSKQEQEQFFKDCLQFHIDTYCGGDASKVINAVVHLDEKTAHLSCQSLPIVDQDGKSRLSAKIIMGGRSDYHKRQDKFHEVIGKPRGLQRGEVKDPKTKKDHLTKREWQLKQQTAQFDDLSQKLQSTREILNQVTERLKTANKSLTNTEFEYLYMLAEKDLLERSNADLSNSINKGKQIVRKLIERGNLSQEVIDRSLDITDYNIMLENFIKERGGWDAFQKWCENFEHIPKQPQATQDFKQWQHSQDNSEASLDDADIDIIEIGDL